MGFCKLTYQQITAAAVGTDQARTAAHAGRKKSVERSPDIKRPTLFYYCRIRTIGNIYFIRISGKRQPPHRIRRGLLPTLIDHLPGPDANTIIFGCNAILASIRIDDQQKKLDELEKLVKDKFTD